MPERIPFLYFNFPPNIDENYGCNAMLTWPLLAWKCLLVEESYKGEASLFISIWKTGGIKQHHCWLDLKVGRKSSSLDKSKRAIDLQPMLCCFMLHFHSFIVASANRGPLVAVILCSRVKCLGVKSLVYSLTWSAICPCTWYTFSFTESHIAIHAFCLVTQGKWNKKCRFSPWLL